MDAGIDLQFAQGGWQRTHDIRQAADLGERDRLRACQQNFHEILCLPVEIDYDSIVTYHSRHEYNNLLDLVAMPLALC